MFRRFITGAALATAVGFAVPTGASASLDLTSSMLARCVGPGGSCASVEFTLNVDGGDRYVDIVNLYSTDVTVWQFGSVVSAPAGWSVTHNDGEILLQSGAAALEPVVFTVAMTVYGPESDFALMDYAAHGYLDANFTADNRFSTDGTVTPEPISMVLLASGLMGVAGAGARRRKQEQEDAEV